MIELKKGQAIGNVNNTSNKKAVDMAPGVSISTGQMVGKSNEKTTTNPLLQTPALKVWKGDISLQQGIKEAKKQEELRTTIPSRTYDASFVEEVRLRDEMKKAEQNLKDVKANDNRNLLEKVLQYGSSIDPIFNAKKDYNKAKKEYEDYKAIKFYDSLPDGEAKTTNPDNKKDYYQQDKSVDWLHEYINNFNNYREKHVTTNPHEGYYKYALMDDREIGIYNYLYNIDVDKAKEFLKFIDDDLNQRQQQKNLETAYKFTGKNAATAVAGSVASVPVNLIAAGEQTVNSINYLLTGEIKENTSTQFANAMRSAVTDKYDWEIVNWDAFDFIYNTAMSGADSIAAASMGNWGAVALGLSAAANTTNDIISRGGTAEQAFWGGVASGVFEGFFEKFSIGQLNAMKDSVGSGFKVYASNMAKSMLVNGSEETATEVANILYDYAANGGISQYAELIKEYMQKNPKASEKSARDYAAKQLGIQIIQAGASGVLMGFGFGALGSAFSHKNASSIGKIIAANGMESQVLDLALKTDENSTAYKLAAKISNSGEMSTAKIGNLAVETITEFSNKKNNIVSNAVYNRMLELGINESNALNTSKLFASVLSDDNIKNTIRNNLNAEPVIKQITVEMQNPKSNLWVAEMTAELGVVENAISQITEATKFSQNPSLQNSADNDIISNNEQVGDEANGGNSEIYNDSERSRGESSDTESGIGTLQGHDGGSNREVQSNGNFGRSSQMFPNQRNNRRIEPTAEQKESLKTTAIKDENGNPKVVSHFTDNMDFETFEKGDIGFHFGNEQQAIEKGKNLKKSGRIIKAHLDIKNPLNIPTDLMNWTPFNIAFKLSVEGIISADDYAKIITLTNEGGSDYNSPAAVELRKILGDLGYDGIVYENMFEADGESYIAFYPEQVIIIDDGKNQADPNGPANFMPEGENEGEVGRADGEIADFGGIDTARGKHLNKAQQDEITAIGEKLDRKVVYEDFYNLDKFKGKKKIPDGYLAKDGTVHINYYAKRPVYFLFKHEITHCLKRTLASYNDFMNLVIDSNAFKDWLNRNGYSSIDTLKTEIMDTYNEIEGFDESRCYDEILANFVGEYLFGGENTVSQKLINALEPKQKKTFREVISDIINYFKSKFQKNKPIHTEIDKIENEFIKVYKEAVEVKADEVAEESYSFTGYAEDGRGKYKSNFPKGTPKMAKADKILNYIQNVWSKKPIKLKIEENGSIKYIEAKFDPTYDESGNIPTDASKLMGGNRHGTSSEQRVTLDLADDYYQIASESQYNYSKDETGKDNPTHKDVTKWHYFINDIYFAEYDSNEYEPYRVSINVKEKVDGEYVYSFSAEKERESDTPRTLHAVVNDGNNPDANVELSNNKLTQPELIVKDNISEDGDIYSIPSSTNAESLLKSYEKGEISRQEYLNALKKEKTLNPLEIANLSERDANTTPEHAKKKGESKGNGESNTYNSLLESDIFDDTFKKEMKESSFVKKYATVTNEETLKTAAKELDEGGLNYVNKWWSIKPERASLIDTAVGFILMDRYQRIGDYQSAVAAAEKVREFGTASGQQVQIFSVLGRLDPNTMVVYAQKELSKAFDEMVKTRTQKWIDKNADKFNLTDNELEFIRRRTLQAAKLPEGRDKAIKLAEIATLLQDKLPPQKGEGLKTLQRMSMLLNAKTNIRNITGNGVMVPVFIFSDFFGSGIDKWVSTKTGVRTTGNFDVKSAKGLKKGAFETMDDFRRHVNTRNSEMNRFEIGSGKAFDEHHDGKFAKQLDEVAKVLNALDRFTSFCLEMGDRPFYEMWFINSLNNQMQLNNVSEATSEMVAIASSEALQRTWQDTNKVVKAVAGTKNTLNYISIGGYGLGDVLIKFTKTPANLTKAIFDFSPAGLITSLASDGLTLLNAVKKGAFKPKMQKQFVDSLSKGITGTLLYILAASLASAGVLGGGNDEDKDVSDFEKYIQGIPEYSFKFAGKWWSYEWMQPVGAIAATVTDYMKSKENNPDNNFFENTLEAIKAGGEVLYNQSFMKSIQNLFTADNIVDGLIDAILDDPSVYVPQLLSQVANVTDEYRRTTYEKDKPLQNALNRVKVKIPRLRQTLPKSVDVLGREIPNSQKGVFNAFFNPANTFTDTSTPVTDHVYELYTKTKNKTLIPRVAPYSVTVKGITKNFTPEEKNDFQRISGVTSSEILEIAFKSDGYKKLSDEQKVEFINDVYGFATKMAKSSIEYDYTTLSAMVGEYSNGKPILSESDYKKLPEEAREMLAQQYFFNKTEIEFLDDYKALIQWYIKQAEE